MAGSETHPRGSGLGDAPVNARAQQILATYGAAPQRWPLDERGSVLDAVIQDPAAADAHRREAALDQILSAAPSHAPSAALIARIRAGALPAVRDGWRATLAVLFARPSVGFLRPASALAGAILLGVVVGAMWAPADDANAMAAEFVTIVFGHDFQGGSGLE
jgi:hypothetical protein